METAERTRAHAEADVFLHERRSESVFFELTFAPRAREEPPLVLESLEPDNEDPGKRRLLEGHAGTSRSFRHTNASGTPSETS